MQPASPPIESIRPAETSHRQRCCQCGCTLVGEDGRARLLAPFEEPLGEGEVCIDDAEEEVQPLKHAASPIQPSAEKVEEHRVDHLPFRSWCKFCISGRGLGQPHALSPSEPTIAIVGLDYFFITCEGVLRRDELEFAVDAEGEAALAEAKNAGGLLKAVVIRCFQSKNVFAHVVPVKGDDEEHYCARLVLSDIEWLGHTRVVLKSDNENSIVAVRKRVARMLKLNEKLTNVQEESPVPYDSQSNGAIEVGVRLVRGMFRTLKLCLEARIGKYIPAAHAITAWLLEHTCILLNARCRGSDGLTPWQRIKGRSFRQLLLSFGECILYKLPTKGPDSNLDGNMGSRWLEGLFLGYSRSSNAYIVATAEGVTTARSLHRRPLENRWSFSKLSALSATPWSQREKPELEVRFQDGEREEARKRTELPLPKAFRITYGDLVEHGFTVGCKQCEYNEVNQRSKPGVSHSNICRRRLLDALMTTPAGQQRLEQYEEKIDQAIADRGPDYPWEPGGVGSGASAALGSDGSVLFRATDEALQPRRSPTGSPTLEAVKRASNDGPQTRTTPAGASSSRPTQDTDMGVLELNRDKESAYILEQLGYANHNAKKKQKRRRTTTTTGSLAPFPHAHARAGVCGAVAKAHSAGSHVVSEIYSPPRVTLEISRGNFKHLTAGLALDLTVDDPDDGCPWDFSLAAKRAKARKLIRQSEPILLIGSPMCTAFSTWQRLNYAKSSDPTEMHRAFTRACLHIEFVAELYREQVRGCRYFLHEHPRFASSWELECMKQLESLPQVGIVRADQCQYGAEAQRGPQKGQPVKKPTGFMSNSCELLKALSRRCAGQGNRCSRPGGGGHATCSGNVCKDAAIYPRELCRAVLRGILSSAQSRWPNNRGMLRHTVAG